MEILKNYCFLFLLSASVSSFAMDQVEISKHEMNILDKKIVKLVIPQGGKDFFKYMFPELFSNLAVITTEQPGLKLARVTLEDNSEWVILHLDPQDRIKGYLYLKGAIESMRFQHVKAARNAMITLNKSLSLLSEYVGEQEVDFGQLSPEQINEVSRLEYSIGYKDLYGPFAQLCSRNLRLVDGIIYVYDTESRSFYPSKHEQIGTIEPVFRGNK